MLVRGLEPKLRKSGTGGKIRKFSGVVIFLELRAGSERFSVISVPDIALAHRARIKNSKWPPQNTKHSR